MSYCRWSSDNWKCDLYCYADCGGGYTTWVAGRKHKGDIPKLPPLGSIGMEEWHLIYTKQKEFLDTAEMEDIGLKYDGQNFNDPDLRAFLKRLLHLKETGYNVPDFVIEGIKEDIKLEDT